MISHDEATEILGRFNASHWNNKTEHARYSIPARPGYDDDLQLAEYIKQNAARDVELSSLRAALEASRAETREARELMERWRKHGHENWHDHTTTGLDIATRAFLAGRGGCPTAETPRDDSTCGGYDDGEPCRLPKYHPGRCGGSPTERGPAHVCECSNDPCPACGGGPSGEWYDGSDVVCDDCDAHLEVLNVEKCFGRSSFGLVFCEECDDAKRLTGKDKVYVSDAARHDAAENCGCEGKGDSKQRGDYRAPLSTGGEPDRVPREPGCQCHLEIGDSPCRIHGDECDEPSTGGEKP